MMHEPANEPALIARRRVLLCELPQSKQPFHTAENMELREAQNFIARCRATTIALALKALRQLRGETGMHTCAGLGLTASSPRELPVLPVILHSHALIHAAEGIFYREALMVAAERLDLKTCAIANRAALDFLGHARDLRAALERIGKSAGPPWTQDEKCACLAALSLLPGPVRKFHLAKLGQSVH